MSEFVGYRVARWRELSGLTQAQLGERVGVGQPAISMIENGARAVTKRSLLISLAEALGVSVSELLNQPRPPSSADDLAISGAVGAIRHALDGELDPVSLPDGPASAANDIITARANCDVLTLSRLVPQVIAQTFPEVNDQNPDLALLDAAVKASVFGCYAVKTAGYVDLAMRLADHARITAGLSGDSVHRAAATMAMCQALMASGSRKRALQLSTTGADDLQDLLGNGDAVAGWYVSLHLQAALCSASLGHHDDAESHLDEAADVAARTGLSEWHRDDIATDAAIWRVTVALENGHAGERAPELAMRVDRSKIRTPQRLARLFMDTGRGYYFRDEHDNAVRMFSRAYDRAPSEVRNRGTVREIVGQLVRDAGERGGNEPLRDLAVKLSIAPVESAA